MTKEERTLLYIAGGAILALVFIPGLAGGITRSIVRSAGEAAGGVIVGAGEAVGIPATNQSQCERDMTAGKTWDASFSCPAGTFLRYLFS